MKLVTEIILYVALALQALGLLLTLIRMLIGPSLPDRLAGLDFFSACLIGLAVTYGMINNAVYLIDITLILALVGFLSTIIFAYYLMTKSEDA